MTRLTQSTPTKFHGRVVYRYFKAEYALQALQQLEWKLGRFTDLNDPLDCRPVLVDSDRTPVANQNHPFWQKFADEHGIICFSDVINDPVVWSHYADGHKGIALGFDFSPEQLHQVSYLPDNHRAVIYEEHLVDVEAKQSSISDLIALGYASKAKSWAYEKEFRYVLPLSLCTMKGSHYFLKLPLEHLRYVVLGVRCQTTPRDIFRILNSCHSLGKPHSIEVRQAVMNQTSFNLDLACVKEEPPMSSLS